MAKIQWNRIRTWWGESGARFALSQGRRLLLGCVIGPLFGIALHLTVKDSAFQLAIRNKWTRLAFPADGVHAYKLELLVLCGVVVVILLLLLGPQVWRFLRAWWAGITSVTTILTALITTAALEYHVTHYKKTWSAYAIILCGAIALEYWRQRSTPHRRLPINARPQPLTIPAREATSVSADRWKASTSDDPIQNWDEDILGRTAVVELLAEHALTLGTPVVALHGDLGDGKSSVLNLLRKTLEPAAIVVSFNAWLPGNEATFAIDLFRDIATECKKRLYVPQLRKRALIYARTISGSFSYLGGLKEILPAESQRDEIYELQEALARVQLPIVVLLDELDRMQKEELLVVLKVLRGVSSIPNITFVCAFSETDVRRRLLKDHELPYEYLEKFFP